MIGWLSGVVRDDQGGQVVLDVNGVGYLVNVAGQQRTRVGESVELLIRTTLREDTIVLYGFQHADERDLFDALLATPGVGPSTAIAALRTLSMGDLVRAIQEGDVKTVSSIPGIGAKTASRIVLELRERVVAPESPITLPRDLDDALRTLGYSAGEIRTALAEVDLPEDEPAALRLALSRLGRG